MYLEIPASPSNDRNKGVPGNRALLSPISVDHSLSRVG